MRSPFSAWFLLYAMIGACIALFAYEEIFRSAFVFPMKSTVVWTMGTVRSLGTSTAGAAPDLRAVVVLADGAVVNAMVFPACPVGVGDPVAVGVLEVFPLVPKTYWVTGANR